MLRDAASCCSWCLRATIASGRLSFTGSQGGKAAAMVSLLRRLHAQQRLPDVQLIIAYHDIWSPGDWDTTQGRHRCEGRLLPSALPALARDLWDLTFDSHLP